MRLTQTWTLMILEFIEYEVQSEMTEIQHNSESHITDLLPACLPEVITTPALLKLPSLDTAVSLLTSLAGGSESPDEK